MSVPPPPGSRAWFEMGWDDYARGNWGVSQPAAQLPHPAPSAKVPSSLERVLALRADFHELPVAEQDAVLRMAGVSRSEIPGTAAGASPPPAPLRSDTVPSSAAGANTTLEGAARERVRIDDDRRKAKERAAAAVDFPMPLRCDWASELAKILTQSRWPTLEVFVERPDPKSDRGAVRRKKVGNGWFAAVVPPGKRDYGESIPTRKLFALLSNGDLYSGKSDIGDAIAGQASPEQLDGWRKHAEAIAATALRERRRFGRPKYVSGRVFGDSSLP